MSRKVLDRLRQRLDRLDGQLVKRTGLIWLGMAAVLFALASTRVLSGAWPWLAGVLLAGAGAVAYLSGPHVEASRLVALARTLVAGGQYRKALMCANEAVALAPYLAGAFIVRSAAYAGMGQIDMAVDDAEYAVRVAPRQPEARLARARVYSFRGLHEDAIHDLRVGLKARPDWIVGHFEIAQLYVKLQDYENGLAALAYLSGPATPAQTRYDAMILTGWVYEEKLKDLDKAIAAYTRAIPILPDRKIGYLRRAFAYDSRGDLHQAAEDLLRAAERLPTPEDTGQYHWLRAVCFARRFKITHEAADLRAWVEALQRSIAEDAAEYRAQARQMLQMLTAPRQSEFPPTIRFNLN